jgi:hypothetical protein
VTLVELSDGSLRVDLDVSALGERVVRLEFRLLGGGLPDDASITIDNVENVAGAPPGAAVPAPPSLLLGLTAAPVLVLLHRRRLRRSGAAA